MSGKEIHTKETFQVLGMSCAVCALNVETTLGAQEGVYEAKVNFAGSTAVSYTHLTLPTTSSV